MFDDKQKSCVKHIHVVTDDGLYDRKAFYKVKKVFIHPLRMMANLSIILHQCFPNISTEQGHKRMFHRVNNVRPFSKAASMQEVKPASLLLIFNISSISVAYKKGSLI